jgi:hypothetical protein
MNGCLMTSLKTFTFHIDNHQEEKHARLPVKIHKLAAANDKVYQLLDHGQVFTPGTPSSSTTKTGRHDLAEILL